MLGEVTSFKDKMSWIMTKNIFDSCSYASFNFGSSVGFTPLAFVTAICPFLNCNSATRLTLPILGLVGNVKAEVVQDCCEK